MDEYCYGLDGQPITFEQWAAIVARKHVARSTDKKGWSKVEDDETRIGLDLIGEAVVSTVWIGIDMGFGMGPPLVFETMIFDKNGPVDDECWRYPTREAALAGHDRITQSLRDRVPRLNP